MTFASTLKTMDKALGKLPSVEQVEGMLEELERAYDDLTEAYIERRLRLVQLLASVQPVPPLDPSIPATFNERPSPGRKRGREPVPETNTRIVWDWIIENGPSRIPAIRAGTGVNERRLTTILYQSPWFTRPERGVWDIIREPD